MSHDCQSFLQQKGILFQRSCPYTQQNRVGERKNRHLLDVVNVLLLESLILPRIWVEELSTAVHLINRFPAQHLGFDLPYFRLYDTHPSYDMLHTFGFICFVRLPPHEHHKFAAQSKRYAFMGYNIADKGFICYDGIANRFHISRNMVFFENQYSFQQHIIFSDMVPFFSSEDGFHSVERFKPGLVYQRWQPPALKRSTRITQPPNWYGFFATLSYIIDSTSYS